MDQSTTTTILAIWGAVLSSFAVGWNIYRDVTQRGRLRISCYIGKLIGASTGPDPKDYLVYSVTNHGKEPVMVTHIGGINKSTEFIINIATIPRMLRPGEYILEHTSDLKALGPDLRNLIARDSLGRVWKAPRRQVKKLKRDYATGKYAR